MDDLLDLVLGILFEGALEPAGSRRVPLPVRVAIAAVLAFLAAVLLGLAALLLLAGADGVEGTLFGNGEGTGNVDLITLALNLYTHGVDPRLDFSDMPSIVEVYERVTRMHVYERSP